MQLRYQRELDGLRALAVLAVIAFHLDIPGFSGGFVGVDIFFVISGFLITGVIRGNVAAGTFRFSEFYSRRARRLFPAAFVTILATFVIGAFVMSPVAFGNLSYSALAAVLSVSNITFWLESGYFEDSNWTKPLLHTWSLGIEEQFYLLWPAAMVFALSRGRKNFVPAAIIAVAVTGVLVAEICLQFASEAAFFLLPFRISEFAIGAALVWISPDTIRSRSLREVGFVAGIVAIALSVLLFDSMTRFPGANALLPCLGTALCIYFCQSFAARLLLGNPPAVTIGRISYSLYLVHWPIIVFAKYYLLRDLTVLEVILAAFATFALAILLYRHVEQPFRIKTNGKSFAGPKHISAAIAACVFLLAVPAVSAQVDGWRWRLPSRVAQAEAIALRDAHYGGLDCDDIPCETGSSALPKVYVIGDSHARSLYAGLIAAFPGVNFIIYAPDGCGFYSTRYLASSVSTDSNCRTLRASAYKEISRSDAPVIIFQLWSFYARLPHYPEDGVGISIQSADALAFSSFVSKQIDDMILQLNSRSIIVIGGLPRFANIGSPEDCFSRPLQRLPCATSLKRSRTDLMNAVFNEAITATANKSFVWIDPFKYLCDLTHCRNLTPDGQTIYADGDHLSILGSEYLVRLFRPIIARELENLSKPAVD